MAIFNKDSLRDWFLSADRPSWTLYGGRTANSSIIAQYRIMPDEVETDRANIETSWSNLSKQLDYRNNKGVFYLDVKEHSNATKNRFSEVLDFSSNTSGIGSMGIDANMMGIFGMMNNMMQNSYNAQMATVMAQNENEKTRIREEYERKELRREFEDFKKRSFKDKALDAISPQLPSIIGAILGNGKESEIPTAIGTIDVPKGKAKESKNSNQVDWNKVIYQVQMIKPHFPEVEELLSLLAAKFHTKKELRGLLKGQLNSAINAIKSL